MTNLKLPEADRSRVELAYQKYLEWSQAMDAVSGSRDDILGDFIRLLNAYKLHIEFDLIFCSSEDFLYRQNGQIKLANSILEEFLPRLFDVRLVPGFKSISNVSVSPATCFSHLSFGSPLQALDRGGVFVKSKDQDFAVTKSFDVSISGGEGTGARFAKTVSVAYFATEIKTNLDKTMFQEATATAAELKSAVPGSRYILLCEWLDMAPIDTKLTSIDEVIVLRKQKRLASSARERFSSVEGRMQSREFYYKFLSENPIHLTSAERFVGHLNEVFPHESGISEAHILERGYF